MKKRSFLFFIFKAASQFIHLVAGYSSFCRYPVSCCEYGVERIIQEGWLRGGVKALKRVLSCHPLKGVRF